MSETVEKLVVAISSRALFDLEESHHIYADKGVAEYSRYQIDHEDRVLTPGVAFPVVKKLLALNERSPLRHRVEVILLSRNSADTGLRIFNSVAHHGLDISRAAFTSGAAPFRYVAPFAAHLFLSANGEDVRAALAAGYAAATILPSAATANPEAQIRIAFDGDAVLFSDEAEQVFQSEGLEAFTESEKSAAREPLPGGPFKQLLAALQRIQVEFPSPDSPLRTALVTARAAPTHERVIRTLRAWGIRIDEAFFLGGMSKGEFLSAFGADIFFEDQEGHCQAAAEHVATGHVPHGVTNS